MSADLIKELREKTGVSFKEIKKALDDAGGDKEKALEILKSLGAAVAEKKSARTTGQGIIEAYIHNTKKVGALVILLCETDFVARNPLFTELARELVMHIAAMDPADNDELLAQTYIRDQNLTVKQLIEQYIGKLGENIKIGKFTRFNI